MIARLDRLLGEHRIGVRIVRAGMPDDAAWRWPSKRHWPSQ